MLRCIVVVAAVPLAGLGACKERSVGTSGDAAVGPDSGPVDAQVLPDGGGETCNAPRLHMGLVWDTDRPAVEVEPSVLETEVAGAVIYLGPVTVPLASNPAFDHEIQIQHGDGHVSVVQWYLPPGIALPVQQGQPTTFTLRDRQGFEGSAYGLVISRPTSGLPPLLFVGDTGTYGRAFTPEDPAMVPLKVYVEPRPECATELDPDCGGTRFTDRLRFDTSTGGAVIDVVVPQGHSADLTLFGDPWRVTNLASTHVDQPCPDLPGMQVSYLAVNTTALTCDPSRFYVWDQAGAFGVGSHCDVLFTCPTSAAQIAAIEASSSDADCSQPVADCPPGGPGCTWGNSVDVGQDLYDQLCAVSVLPDAPDRIDCHIYFYSE